MQNNTNPTPHEILGVKSNASQTEIKKAYHRLARTHHPDKGGDEKLFQTISEAYRILTGSGVFIEPLQVPFDKFDDAFASGDISKLDALYAKFPIDFSFDLVLKTLNNQNMRNQLQVINWLFDHGVNPNQSIKMSVTVFKETRYDKIWQGRVIETRYENFSKEYDWTTTLLGMAMFNKNISLICELIGRESVRLENIAIPASATSEEYVTALEQASKERWENVINVLLDGNRCEPPSLSELDKSIHHAYNYGSISKLLRAYRKTHFRFNPFKLGYNSTWHENVDISWKATFNEIPSNFITALKDFYNALFCWAGIYDAIFILLGIAVTALAVGTLIMSIVMLNIELMTYSLAFLFTPIYPFTMGVILLTHDSLRQSYLNFMHNTIDSLIKRTADFVNSCCLKIANPVNAIFSSIKSIFTSSPKNNSASNNIVESMSKSGSPSEKIEQGAAPVIFPNLAKSREYLTECTTAEECKDDSKNSERRSMNKTNYRCVIC